MGFSAPQLTPVRTGHRDTVVREAAGAGGVGRSGTHVTAIDVAAVSVKSAPYAFLIAGIRIGTSSLIGSANLFAKVYMPRMIFQKIGNWTLIAEEIIRKVTSGPRNSATRGCRPVTVHPLTR